MAESKPDRADSFSDKDVKAPNLFERAKEEIEAIFHTEKSSDDHKETHGMRGDIDENTSMDDVKAPNVFERAKEEIEALVQTIHPKKESQSNVSPLNKEGHFTERDETVKTELKPDNPDSLLGKGAKTENSPQHHHKETHGMSDDIDENTPIDDVRGPSVFERAKEELEALIHTIHPKKESPKEEKIGCRVFIGRGLEKVCSPWSSEKK